MGADGAAAAGAHDVLGMPAEEHGIGDPDLGATALLEAAYGEDLGKTGHSLAGHTGVGEKDVAALLEQDACGSLLYGELLPAGVDRLLGALLLSGSGPRAPPGPVLELGMGTGKVALQIFLSAGRDVHGVELAPGRWALADAALRAVAEVAPARFRYEALGAGSSRLSNVATQTCCSIVCGSMLDTPGHLMAAAAAVVMEVCLPADVQRQACALLQHCRAGCRAVCYAPLHGLVDECRLAPLGPPPPGEEPGVSGDGVGCLLLPASWKPCGHGFAFYRLAETAEAAAEGWAAATTPGAASARVEVDDSGCPSRGRRMKYTDDALVSCGAEASFQRGDRVLVGFSWLPFPDLGDPGDELCGTPDGVTWMPAVVVGVKDSGCATLCYTEDGTVEEDVRPERLRRPGCRRERRHADIDWGDF